MSCRYVEIEKARRVAPEDLFLVSRRDRKLLDDVDVLLWVDRHRAVIGAEHDAIHAENVYRFAHVWRPETHGVDAEIGEVVTWALLAADHRALGRALASEPPAEIEAPDNREKPAAHVGDHDLQARVAVEQPRQDHACERHGGVERPSHQLVELELVHLLVVPDRDARRMDEQGHLARLRPFPERKGVRVVDELAVPARGDQQALEAERRETALAFRDVTGIERIERAQAPI